LNPKLLGIIAAIVAVLVLVGLVWYLYAVSPATYSRTQPLQLSFEQTPPWRTSYCIPGTEAGQPEFTNVSFNWTTRGGQQVDFVVWPSPGVPGAPVYNMTAASGSGHYSSQGTEWFAAFGVPSPSTVVSIQLAFTVPGHTWGGPIVNIPC
jgi:hypothetical protein